MANRLYSDSYSFKDMNPVDENKIRFEAHENYLDITAYDGSGSVVSFTMLRWEDAEDMIVTLMYLKKLRDDYVRAKN